MSYRPVAQVLCGILLGLAACGGSSGGSWSSQGDFSKTVTSIVNEKLQDLPIVFGQPSRSRVMAFPVTAIALVTQILSQMIPATPSQIYQIASVSKQFTATAIKCSSRSTAHIAQRSLDKIFS